MSGRARNLLKTARGRRRLLVDVSFGFALLIVLIGVALAVPQVYAQKLVPGMWVGNVAIGGQTKVQALATMQSVVDAVAEQGLRVTVDGKVTTVPIQQALTTSDITPPLVDLDPEASVRAAFAYGHDFGVIRNALQFWRATILRKHIEPAITVDELVVEASLRTQFGAKDDPAQPAHLKFANGEFTVVPEKAGNGFVYQPAVAAAIAQWQQAQPAVIALTRGTENSRLTADRAQDFIDDAQAVVQRAPFSLTLADGKTSKLDAATVGAGLDVVLSAKNKVVLAFTEAKLASLLKQLKENTDIPAKESRFRIVDGKVAEFQQGQVGRTFDLAATVAAMNTALLKKNQKTVAAVITEVKPQSAADSAVALGITELVATGKTNFAGSPTNRRKNIANAVRFLNGLLIKPGEDFSLVKALSPIELSNGYLPELVIKGNRTIPEVGGGLCQVGTTMFRLALDAGVPILERRNHSYRVSYYEPPVGMDATLYDPKPDFRIKNDYESALLLQARVSGDNLIFDFYGTKDTRVATSSTPKLFNVTKPPATKYIKTTDLKPGQKKRLERAHNGGSTSFTYTVTKDGKTTPQTFNSVYRAWQEVWLVGATAEEIAADAEV
ncbi:MAG: VanW family protein [bacterium]|nr:VanW family protein [bacterium]